MGHYDSSRPGYCAACGAAPGNHRADGTCEFCVPDGKTEARLPAEPPAQVSNPMYRILEREVQAEHDGKKLDFKVKRYYATFLGRDPKDSEIQFDPFVEVWVDGSITVNTKDKRLFLYDDQWTGIVTALELAMRRKREALKDQREKWKADTMDARVFHGVHVDLSRREVINALTNCDIKTENVVRSGAPKYTDPYILFRDRWHSLGRTDLMDDVATGWCTNKTPEAWRKHYLKKAVNCMGGRLTENGDTPLFSVIDSYSDG